MSAIIANAIKIGNILSYKEKLWKVFSTEHVKPGKGGAFVQVELRGINHSTKLNERFRSNETVDRVTVEARDATFLYKSIDSMIFMDSKTFEEINVPIDMIGDKIPFIHDGINLEIEVYNDNPIGIRLPNTVTLEVSEAEPGMKNQTATAMYKNAVLSNGLSVQVPQFVNVGDKVVIDTETISYNERAK